MKTYRFLIYIILSLLLLSACDDDGTGGPAIKPPEDVSEKVRASFSSAEDCKGCHPVHYEEWAMSMHAYSFTDPVFFRLNDIGQERSHGELDQFCVRCHGPVASMLNETPVGFERAQVSALGREGVTCDVCHKIKSFRPGHAIDAFHFDNTQRAALKNPIPNGFHESVYDSTYSRSDICAGCHNIVNPLGVEVERTFTEWSNSLYPGRGIPCQTCHMKTYTGQAAVGGPVRNNLHQHIMEGVDIPLTDFPGRERMIARVDTQLRYSLIMLIEAPKTAPANQDLNIAVVLANTITGHSIPSGSVFERQMWIEILVRDSRSGDTIFSSGLTDPNHDLLDHNSEYVQQGLMKPDTNLALYTGKAYRNGAETPFFWEAHSVRFRTIPAFEERVNNYRIPAGLLTGRSNIFAQVRLRFRAFAPYFLRKIGHPELYDKVVVFTMEEDLEQIALE